MQLHNGGTLSGDERKYVAELIAQMIVDKMNRQSGNQSITTNGEVVNDN